MVVGGRWLMLAASSLAATGCAPPCVDDGLHAQQHGAKCAADATTGGTSSTGSTGGTSSTGVVTPVTETSVTTTSSGTGTGDSSSGSSSTGGLTGGSETSTSSSGGSESGSDEGTTGTLHCTDKIKDDEETDVDCGGGKCDPCQLFQLCLVGDDCVSGACHAKGVCVPANCVDDKWDLKQEKHVDCGDSCGATCGIGFPCDENNDCFESDCQGGTCGLFLHCADNEFVMRTESDVDCGKECGATCKEGQFCSDDADCFSNDCAEICEKSPECGDGQQNFGETDIDCGGPCIGCGLNKACVGNADCGPNLGCSGSFVCTAG